LLQCHMFRETKVSDLLRRIEPNFQCSAAAAGSTPDPAAAAMNAASSDFSSPASISASGLRASYSAPSSVCKPLRCDALALSFAPCHGASCVSLSRQIACDLL
jgi:hypothetical protein